MRSTEELRRRLGTADVEQIRALLRVPPEQRIETMLEMQAVVLNMWRDRFHQTYRELDDLALTRLIFTRLYQNG
jgi:hypothetical protein